VTSPISFGSFGSFVSTLGTNTYSTYASLTLIVNFNFNFEKSRLGAYKRKLTSLASCFGNPNKQQTSKHSGTMNNMNINIKRRQKIHRQSTSTTMMHPTVATTASAAASESDTTTQTRIRRRRQCYAITSAALGAWAFYKVNSISGPAFEPILKACTDPTIALGENSAVTGRERD
jgi:hypothetical protein